MECIMVHILHIGLFMSGMVIGSICGACVVIVQCVLHADELVNGFVETRKSEKLFRKWKESQNDNH